ncbi:MAG: aminopeptidase [Clostridia bacterium]|nr:aminopeptidase [Clostridia bacterium]
MRKRDLERYADLIVRAGLNVQPGQEVFITASLDQPEFVAMTAEACYRTGASRVTVDYGDQRLTALHVKYRSPETLAELPPWEEARWQHMADRLSCRLYLESEDPDGLSGVDGEKMSAGMQARARKIKPYRDRMEDRHQWCIAAVPGAAWAKKLFPGETRARAVEKLWNAILDTSRARGDGVANWEAHDRDLRERCRRLNEMGIARLHYTAGNGTDLPVGMIPEAEFRGGGDTTLSGVFFNPNIPTEECFISPKRGEAEGVVYASMPLSWSGQLIEDFWIRFEKGKAVEWGAKKNEALLGRIIGMDEGSAYLGECALVPWESPVRQSGLLFYNTLFDENAACHLALGRGFMDTLKDYERYTQEECRALGVNDSIAHVDFMIGTRDLSIDGITAEGAALPVFRDGTWAF